MRVNFAETAYGRADYGLPEARLVNMVSEEGGPAYDSPRLPRPGLVSTYAWDTLPVRGIFKLDGVFSGAIFALIGTTLYKNGSSIGTISGTDLAQFAASANQLVIVCNGAAYVTDGTTVSLITDTDLPVPISVCFLAGRFIYGTTAGQFYWSAVNDAANIDGLAFSTAEASPDSLIAAQTVGDELFLFGANSVEVWDATGDNNQPFQRAGSKRFDVGCWSANAVATMDNTVFWVGDDGIVYRASNVPQRVSTNGIETRIRKATGTIVALVAIWEGHSVYVLNIPGQGSYGYDAATQNWAEWQSYGRTTFRGSCSLQYLGQTYVGDDTNGKIWVLTPGTYTDGTDPITFIASAWVPVPNGRPRCDNAVLQGARGVGTTTGQGSAPITEMRYSDDQGRTFCDWIPETPGAIGVYGRPPRWRRLGLMKAPGRLFEIRTTDPVLATAGTFAVNEAAWIS